MKMCEQILKNTAGQVLTYNSKIFHLLNNNKKLEPERTMIELGKPFLKKSDEEVKTENQSQNAACEQKIH